MADAIEPISSTKDTGSSQPTVFSPGALESGVSSSSSSSSSVEADSTGAVDQFVLSSQGAAFTEINKKVDTLSIKMQKLLSEGKVDEAAEVGKELAQILEGGPEALPVPEDSFGDSFIDKVSGLIAPEAGEAIQIPKPKNLPIISESDPSQGAGYVNGEVRPYNGQLVSPLEGYHVTSEFGPRPSMGDYHTGIDLGAAKGTAVRSVADGTVTRVANDPDGYGNWVEVKHADGTSSRYAHLSAFGNIKVGQQIGAGSVLGAVGSTGHSTGPHLHFEWRDASGKALDPRKILNF